MTGPAGTTEFRQRFLAGLLEDVHRYQRASNRVWRPNASHRKANVRAAAGAARDIALRTVERVGLTRRHFDTEEAAEQLGDVVANIEGYDRAYSLLADESSREVLIDLLKFRVLGPGHVRLPVTVSQFEAERARLDRECLQARATVSVSDPMFPVLNRYVWQGANGPLTFDSHAVSVVSTFVLRQYQYTRDGLDVGAHEGDLAIDAGGCWGDTALCLADRVGPQGKVLCFEFTPDSIAVIRRNLELNEHVADRVDVVPEALWSESGKRIGYSQTGAFTSLAMDRGGGGPEAAGTVTLDDFASRAGLTRVDFIKMDIEGAEMPALRGAERVLRSHRPTLAIAAYHYDHDLIDIPAFLADLDVGYRLYLDHFSAGRMETVLFATAR